MKPQGSVYFQAIRKGGLFQIMGFEQNLHDLFQNFTTQLHVTET